MSGASELRTAAITEAARAAGAHDPTLVAKAAAGEATMSPAEIVATLKATKPFLFAPRQARDMNQEEYEKACRSLGIRRRASMRGK